MIPLCLNQSVSLIAGWYPRCFSEHNIEVNVKWSPFPQCRRFLTVRQQLLQAAVQLERGVWLESPLSIYVRSPASSRFTRRFLSAVFVHCPGHRSMSFILSVPILWALLLDVPRLRHYDSFSQVLHIFSLAAFTVPDLTVSRVLCRCRSTLLPAHKPSGLCLVSRFLQPGFRPIANVCLNPRKKLCYFPGLRQNMHIILFLLYLSQVKNLIPEWTN